MFWQRYLELCKQKGQSPNAVCNQLGLSNAAVTHWKNGSVPRNSTLKIIAEYFNVSVDYLVGKTDKQSNSITLTAHEMQLVLAYRTHPEMQKAVDTLLGFDSADNSVQSDIQKTVAAINAATQKEPTVQK